MRDLELTSEQKMLADAVTRLCATFYAGDGEEITRPFVREHWDQLAELGVLELAAGETTDALALSAVSEQLGRVAFAGPFVQAVIAANLVDGDQRTQIMSGRKLPALADGSGPTPWAAVSDVLIALDSNGDARVIDSPKHRTPVATLAGDEWAEIDTTGGRPVGDAGAALAIGNIALAGLLVGSAARMVDEGADFARVRMQFGRPIGDFQAVAHPLADAYLSAVAARSVTRYAALHFDAGDAGAHRLAAAARLSAAEAARQAAYVVHQVFGGMGNVEGTLLSVLSRRAVQLAVTPPGPAPARKALLAGQMPALV